MLKPLAGHDSGLEENLRSFFALEHPDYELLLSSAEPHDPAMALAQSLTRQNPQVRAQVLVSGKPHFPNAKVHSLQAMTRLSTGDVLVISDSDIRTDKTLLEALEADFKDDSVGVVTCPYRAVPGNSFFSLLEALGMNSELWSGILVAQFLFPMDFAVGPTMAIRRSCLQAIGGWQSVRDYLAEDFQIGKLARQAGFEVRLSTHTLEHHIGSQSLRANLAHRLRWCRSTRRSRPAGYWGQLFTNPLPIALLLPILASGANWSWVVLAICITLRYLALVLVGGPVLHDKLVFRYFYLVPFQDVLGLLLWIAGFFGNRIRWRDRTYKLLRNGRLQELEN